MNKVEESEVSLPPNTHSWPLSLLLLVLFSTVPAAVIAAGADSVAVIRAVLEADSPEEEARQIVTRLKAGK